MPKSGPRKIARYGEYFKATVAKSSSLPGVLIQDVAAAHLWTHSAQAWFVIPQKVSQHSA
ncbi:MAG: hypothetical protein EXQ58_03260 [Acidobacteria bacterium]|nr:hypothetical protein [Acidobacteriota bacterium]